MTDLPKAHEMTNGVDYVVRCFALRFVDDESAVKRLWLWLLTQDRFSYSEFGIPEVLILKFICDHVQIAARKYALCCNHRRPSQRRSQMLKGARLKHQDVIAKPLEAVIGGESTLRRWIGFLYFFQELFDALNFLLGKIQGEMQFRNAAQLQAFD